MSRTGTYLVATAVAVAWVGVAQAATVDLEYQGATMWGTPDWHQGTSVTLQGQTWQPVLAGVIRLKDAVTNAPLITFCLDVTTWIGDPPGLYLIAADLLDGPVAQRVQALFDTAYDNVVNPATAAGFQMALWEIVHEVAGNPLDIRSGDFHVSGSAAAMAHATGYLSGLTASTPQRYVLTYLESLSNTPGIGQDLVAVAPIPLPATALLLGGALAGMGFMRRRRA